MMGEGIFTDSGIGYVFLSTVRKFFIKS